jgi:hypothetical protein
LDANASPYPAFSAPPVPLDVTATAGIGRVDLRWSPSGAYTAHGYGVFRGTSVKGPFESIHSTNRWTTPAYTDMDVVGGTKYFYTVAALSQAGPSAKSKIVGATPVDGGSLPVGWSFVSIGEPGDSGNAIFSEAANRSLVTDGAGKGIGGSSDDCSYVFHNFSGDFTLTARLIDRRGEVSRAGLMIRDGQAAEARTLALTLGDIGGRQARFGTRAGLGGKMTSQAGNDYTWLPIWFRLQRAGDAFSAWQSPDGIEWYPVGKGSLSLPKNVLVGFAASGRAKADAAPKVAFDNISLGVNPPAPPAAPDELTVKPAGNSEVRLTWKNRATNQSGFKVEAAWENGIFYEIADLTGNVSEFANTGLKPPVPRRYRVKAYNTGGYSEYSNEAIPAD